MAIRFPLTFYSFVHPLLVFRFKCHSPAILDSQSHLHDLVNCLSLFPHLSLFHTHTHLLSSSFSPDSNRLRCPGTTPLRSNQAWVMRRMIGPLPPGQGQPLEDMIDHDRITMAAWCQRGGMGAHGPPAATLSVPTQLLHT